MDLDGRQMFGASAAPLTEGDKLASAALTGAPLSTGTADTGLGSTGTVDPGPAAPAATDNSGLLAALLAEVRALKAQVASSQPAFNPLPAGTTVEDDRPLFVQLSDKLSLSGSWGDLVTKLEDRARGILAGPGEAGWKTAELEFLGAIHAVARAVGRLAPEGHDPHNDG